MKKFHDVRHGNNRLTRCLCSYRVGGVWSTSRIDSFDGEEIHLESGHSFNIESDDIKYMFDSLGYVNTRHQCVYYYRVPRRMWKVGICNDNVSAEWLYERYARAGEQPKIRQAITDLVVGKYPSFEDSLKLVLKGKVAARAFSPVFAVGLHKETKNPVIYYKNKAVAFIDDDENIVMGDVNSHLQEQLFLLTKKECLV